MNKLFISLISLIFLSACEAPNTKETEPISTTIDYSTLENGLYPGVVIGDRTNETYSIEAAMKKYNVPAVSIALFQDGKIVWAKQYGNKSSKKDSPLNEHTKFQAASISKAVTALGVLKLMESHQLDLDADINTYLKSWKVNSSLTKTEKVSIRRLLDHTSGANIEGFHGYPKTDRIPSIIEILEGKGRSPKLEIKTVPGVDFFYSGGGFAILQVLIEDVSGMSFDAFFQQEVFAPLNMNNSTFNPLPNDNIALGHDKKGTTQENGWLVYPELPAAGLWTCPSDLAKFALALEQSYYEEKDAILPKAIIDEMLTVTKIWGLGIGVRGEGNNQYFFHAGANPGDYKSVMVNFYKQKIGMAIMTNAGQGNTLHDDVLRSFSSFFKNDVFKAQFITPIKLDENALATLTGKYHFKEMGAYFLDLSVGENNQLILYDSNDQSTVKYVPLSPTELIDIESGNKASFAIDSISGKVQTMNYSGAYTFEKIE